MTRRLRGAALASLALLLALGAGTSAFAQEAPLEVRIRQADLASDGTTSLVVQVTGSAVQGTLGADAFTVTEAGQPVSGVNASPLSQSKVVPVTVAIVLDISGSTAGQPAADAKAGAKAFLSSLPPDVGVMLIPFSVRPRVAVGLTTDRGLLSRSIDALQPGGGTALYDAVVLAAKSLGGIADAQRNILVFSDGGDTDSRAKAADAVAEVKAADAPVIAVGLITPAFDQNALNQLAGAVPGGKTVSVNESGQLAGAFTQVAQAISSQYVVTYNSKALTPKDLDISVGVTVGGVSASDSSTVSNPRVKDAKPGQTATEPSGKPWAISAFASKVGLYVGIAGVFVAAFLFLGVIVFAPTRGRAAQVLQRGLRLYSRADRKREKAREGVFGGTAVGRRAVELLEKVPKSEAFEERLQLLLDRAAWPLRATEFIVFQIGGFLAGAAIGFGLLQRWLIGIALAGFGAVAPRMVLMNRISKREALFLSQLPDTLQLLSGSLQAGYGFMQAIDTVAKEASPPTSTEFTRVLSESRLGMPVDEALSSMADRVGGQDFRWVVLAINIQRQVGGNLAALLSTVANTLREREQVRRQIKVLSAEGKLSAIILVLLPFLLAGYISLVNPGYLQVMTKETIGKIMIVAGIVLMTIGIAWMRKIIKIDV